MNQMNMLNGGMENNQQKGTRESGKYAKNQNGNSFGNRYVSNSNSQSVQGNLSKNDQLQQPSILLKNKNVDKEIKQMIIGGEGE